MFVFAVKYKLWLNTKYKSCTARVSKSNCSVDHMRTYKITRGPHCDADETIAVPESNFTSYFLRKVSWIIGKSFLAVSLFVLINSSRLRNLFTRCCGGKIHRRTWNTSRSTAIADGSAGSTPRRDQARSEMQLHHVGLGRHLGRLPGG